MSYEKTICNLVLACSEAAKKLAQQCAMVGDVKPLYLHFKKATDTENGELVLIRDGEPAPQGFELATGEVLGGGVPYDRYYQWVNSRISRLPILAWKQHEDASVC